MDLTQVVMALGIPGIAIVCWALTAIVDSWQKTRRTEAEMALKQEMIERGMSADEIARVLHAGDGTGSDDESPPAVVKKDLGELLAEHGFEADDMVKVLQAAHGSPPAAQATVKGMIENGYAADDIVKVLHASSGRDRSPAFGNEWRPSHAKAEVEI